MKHKIIVIFTAFILFSIASSCSQKQGKPTLSSQANPKNVIMIIGDGMGPEQGRHPDYSHSQPYHRRLRVQLHCQGSAPGKTIAGGIHHTQLGQYAIDAVLGK